MVGMISMEKVLFDQQQNLLQWSSQRLLMMQEHPKDVLGLEEMT